MRFWRPLRWPYGCSVSLTCRRWRQEGYRPAGMGITLLCGIGLALSLSLLNDLAIRRRIGGTGRGRG
ncbi:MAG: hypothetical protein V8Q54_06325 [Alistipes senegalensis]